MGDRSSSSSVYPHQRTNPKSKKRKEESAMSFERLIGYRATRMPKGFNPGRDSNGPAVRYG